MCVSFSRTDVDLAVSDLEEAINVQKEEYNAAVSRFQTVWLTQVQPRRLSSRLITLLPITPLRVAN